MNHPVCFLGSGFRHRVVVLLFRHCEHSEAIQAYSRTQKSMIPLFFATLSIHFLLWIASLRSQRRYKWMEVNSCMVIYSNITSYSKTNYNASLLHFLSVIASEAKQSRPVIADANARYPCFLLRIESSFLWIASLRSQRRCKWTDSNSWQQYSNSTSFFKNTFQRKPVALPFRHCEHSEAIQTYSRTQKPTISLFLVTLSIHSIYGLLRCARNDGINEPIEIIVQQYHQLFFKHISTKSLLLLSPSLRA